MACEGKEIQYISFNETQDMFLVISNDQIWIFNTNPLKEMEHLDRDAIVNSYISSYEVPLFKAELLHRSNVIAIIPASLSKYPRSADNRVLFFNLTDKTVFAEFVGSYPVLSVKLSVDKCVIATEKEIYVSAFPQIRLIETYETHNPLGVLALCTLEKKYIAFPAKDRKHGCVHIVNVNEIQSICSSPKMIIAHENSLACLAFNPAGTLIATSSTKGTLINVYRTDNLSRIARFRRGLDHSKVYCMNFSPKSQFLALISDNATLHMYNIENLELNGTGPLDSFRSFNGLRDLCSFDTNCRAFSVCGFLQNDNVVVINTECGFHVIAFSANGKECKRVLYDIFLDPYDDSGL